MPPLTAKQREVLRFIADQMERGLPSPSVREICDHMGYRSTRAAHDVIAVLIRKGYLAHEPGCARTLRVLSDAWEGLGVPHLPRSLRVGIPVLGSIVAGAPEDAAQTAEDTLPVSPSLFSIPLRHRAFALRVRGDSMIGRHFLPGDLVVCDADANARPGDAVVALIDGKSTLKTLVVDSGAVWLRAENPAYPALHPADELTIQGVACGVVRTQAA